MGIIEAASCGLFVVSTRVGGVPEVLPSHMIRLAEPEEDDVVDVVSDAILYVKSGRHNATVFHDAVASMYSWPDVANRVEQVYHDAMDKPLPSFYERMIW
jgi:phosphatidylinositol glycan class A protein